MIVPWCVLQQKRFFRNACIAHSWEEIPQKKIQTGEYKLISIDQYICFHSISNIRVSRMIDPRIENYITLSVAYTSNLAFDS